MKIVDWLLDITMPFFSAYYNGMGQVGSWMAVVGFCMTTVVLLTQKNIYIPIYLIPVIAADILCAVMALGFILQATNFLNKYMDYQNKLNNPQMKQICEDLEAIKKKLEIP